MWEGSVVVCVDAEFVPQLIQRPGVKVSTTDCLSIAFQPVDILSLCQMIL